MAFRVGNFLHNLHIQHEIICERESNKENTVCQRQNDKFQVDYSPFITTKKAWSFEKTKRVP